MKRVIIHKAKNNINRIGKLAISSQWLVNYRPSEKIGSEIKIGSRRRPFQRFGFDDSKRKQFNFLKRLWKIN